MVFANLTSGTKEQSQAVVSSGAVMPFIRLVDSPRVTLAEQVIRIFTLCCLATRRALDFCRQSYVLEI